MWRKIIAVALPAALLACALAVADGAPQFSSKVSIRFVEVVEIDDEPIPLFGGEIDVDPAEPPPGDAENHGKSSMTIRKGWALRHHGENY